MAKKEENKQLEEFKSTQNIVDFFELLLESARENDELWEKIKSDNKNK